MKPEPSHALERLMQALLTELMPAVQPAYRQASVGAQAMMIALRRLVPIVTGVKRRAAWIWAARIRPMIGDEMLRQPNMSVRLIRALAP